MDSLSANVTSRSFLQSVNASAEIVFTFFPIVTCSRDEHPLNAFFPMEVTLSSMTTVVIEFLYVDQGALALPKSTVPPVELTLSSPPGAISQATSLSPSVHVEDSPTLTVIVELIVSPFTSADAVKVTVPSLYPRILMSLQSLVSTLSVSGLAMVLSVELQLILYF